MNALLLRGAGDVHIELVAESITLRDALLERSATLTSVTDQVGAKAAADMVRELRGLAKAVETSREEVKAPVIQLGRQIDSLAKQFTVGLPAEIDRISRLLTSYTVEQERIRREAEEKRQRELREAQERERKAREDAEATKRRIEAEVKAATASDDPFAKATAEIRGAMLLDDLQQGVKTATRDAAFASVAPALEPVKVAGSSMRCDPEFRINDPLALANARPDLVTITPKRAEILAEMRKLKPWDGEMPIVQGAANGSPVAVGWWERKAVVR